MPWWLAKASYRFGKGDRVNSGGIFPMLDRFRQRMQGDGLRIQAGFLPGGAVGQDSRDIHLLSTSRSKAILKLCTGNLPGLT